MAQTSLGKAKRFGLRRLRSLMGVLVVSSGSNHLQAGARCRHLRVQAVAPSPVSGRKSSRGLVRRLMALPFPPDPRPHTARIERIERIGRGKRIPATTRYRSPLSPRVFCGGRGWSLHWSVFQVLLGIQETHQVG